MRLPRVSLFVAVLMLLGLVSAVRASDSPGRVGAYVRLYSEAGSPHKLLQAMKRMKASGIDFIIPTGKGTSGTVYWDSNIAPKDLVYKDRGYLGKIIRYAHAEGLKVYPVFCVCTEGGDAKPNSLLMSHPSWAFLFDGARRGYIDPGNADARRYETSLIGELVSKYDIDGLSLDYCRCPNRVGYTDSGRDEFLRKHNVDLARIIGGDSEALDTEGGKKALAPSAVSVRANPIWPAWRQWRIDHMNILGREIRAAVDSAKPGLPISSYVWGYHTYTGSFETCQDWVTWINKGILNWINPSGYRYTDSEFVDAARLNRAHVPQGFPFYITIGVTTSHGKLKSAAEVRRQMQMARECGADGLVFFTWEALNPFADDLAGDIAAFRPSETR